jgi:ABC-2 type transport system ATP-binding protein
LAAIILDRLTKKFNGFTAVDHISFQISEGELFGFLGPNGAGKTTTINMLSTLLKPTSGHAKVAGFDIAKNKNEVRKSIGIVFQDPALDIHLTGYENLQFHSMLYGVKKEIRKKKIAEVLELVDLTKKANQLVETYSGGMKRRLEIARGLIHNPKVLFLDEPTLGLDAQTRRNIWTYIKKLNQDHHVTIILTTHYMEEADYLCDRIAIIDQGRIMALDQSEKLKDILGGDVICLTIEKNQAIFETELKKLSWLKSLKQKDNSLYLTVEQGKTKIPQLIQIAQSLGLNILSVDIHKPSLEDVFLHYTGRKIRDEEADHNDYLKEAVRQSTRRSQR